uniref:Uncharacterized protein n=1 Tax=Aegilops tauschii subsp. strangulata TaxID=200361 RepID=A0A453M029_AEGTS
ERYSGNGVLRESSARAAPQWRATMWPRPPMAAQSHLRRGPAHWARAYIRVTTVATDEPPQAGANQLLAGLLFQVLSFLPLVCVCMWYRKQNPTTSPLITMAFVVLQFSISK